MLNSPPKILFSLPTLDTVNTVGRITPFAFDFFIIITLDQFGCVFDPFIVGMTQKEKDTKTKEKTAKEEVSVWLSERKVGQREKFTCVLSCILLVTLWQEFTMWKSSFYN